ncbi:LCP family protein [Brevibacillus porteri]|uniref:Cell envelope-related transcriptional attenuator domain-containing protein n=1 Tax=Brevibacillus porteri TaxID=2126350 RepID=A0ABX5FM27_9BACL|nr:LCP family protein [Brevibacillus porteri]MED1800164.1 LCP family protein [Brevibacillus porteri]MED2131781.1 LCP family protein [Brevibacillus porteri]MED2748028.1 LCP family protein [Brevibacillus porteri]MED2812326.1 LCP family protein [Brevibacillus porteri]MED2896451.1 LCP family protein [Brevibacillus porteri]
MPDTVVKTRASASRKKQPSRNRKIRKLVVSFTLITLLLVGGVAGAIYWKIEDTLTEVTSPANSGFTSPVSQNVDPVYYSDKPMSFVLLGSDTRPETGSMNTDVMIVAVANPKTKKVTMVSIPRDTRVKIPGYRDYHKINSVYANGEAERRQAERNNQTVTEDGISLTKKTLNEVLGIPIEHFVAIDFDGFKAVIDELGGVEVNVDRKLVYDDPTDDTHINLQPGLQKLNGEQALGYVRHRHDNRGTKYYSSDFDRNRRQQEVIKAVVDKTASLEGLTKIFNVMDVGAKNIHTDLSKDQIKGLAYDFKGFNSSTVTALDNGAYWQGGYTYLEKEKLESVRDSLQSEMGLSGSVVASLNNSPILGSGEAVATSNKKSVKKKTTESAASTSAKQKTEAPKEQEPNSTDNQDGTANEGAMPPPDVVNSEGQGQSTDQGQGAQTPATDATQSPGTVPAGNNGNNSTPPPDIIPPSSQDAGPAPTQGSNTNS